MSRINALRLGLGVLTLAGSASALSGVVVDKSGKALGGAKIEMVLRGGSVVTSADGSFDLAVAGNVGVQTGDPARSLGGNGMAMAIPVAQGVQALAQTWDVHGRLLHEQWGTGDVSGTMAYRPFGEAKALPGVYFVKCRIGQARVSFKIVSSGSGAASWSVHRGVLSRQASVLVDTARISLAGFTTQSIPVASYDANLGFVVMSVANGFESDWSRAFVPNASNASAVASSLGIRVYSDASTSYTLSMKDSVLGLNATWGAIGNWGAYATIYIPLDPTDPAHQFDFANVKSVSFWYRTGDTVTIPEFSLSSSGYPDQSLGVQPVAWLKPSTAWKFAEIAMPDGLQYLQWMYAQHPQGIVPWSAVVSMIDGFLILPRPVYSSDGSTILSPTASLELKDLRVRMGTGSAAQIVDLPCEARNAGLVQVGDSLRLRYSFYDPDPIDREGASSFRWLLKNAAAGAWIPMAGVDTSARAISISGLVRGDSVRVILQPRTVRKTGVIGIAESVKFGFRSSDSGTVDTTRPPDTSRTNTGFVSGVYRSSDMTWSYTFYDSVFSFKQIESGDTGCCSHSPANVRRVAGGFLLDVIRIDRRSGCAVTFFTRITSMGTKSIGTDVTGSSGTCGFSAGYTEHRTWVLVQ